MAERLEPWAWKCKLDDSWIGRPFSTEREAAAQIPEFEAEGYSGVTVVPLYPLAAVAKWRELEAAAAEEHFHRHAIEVVSCRLCAALTALRKERATT